jgi:hypothetical protein
MPSGRCRPEWSTSRLDSSLMREARSKASVLCLSHAQARLEDTTATLSEIHMQCLSEGGGTGTAHGEC